MSKVVADISVSLDGYVTGPDPGLEHGLGTGGELLHAWARQPTDVDARVLGGAVRATGAVLMGRRTFDVVDGPYGWGDPLGYGSAREQAQTPPVFVVTHVPPPAVRRPELFTFITDGPAAAVKHARTVAGDGDIVVMGGADLIGQATDEGLLDELRLHLAPLLLGAGTRLFAHARPRQWEPVETHFSPLATHLTYRAIT
ncbi:dihydrofolate reductase family protein [Nonomuraea sp. NPDC049637]|uniref:dihydrofolate reductase family protein n=2 Tax=unclassified Nonomuraea TaxID=2593643 RepID=UPI003428A0EC